MREQQPKAYWANLGQGTGYLGAPRATPRNGSYHASTGTREIKSTAYTQTASPYIIRPRVLLTPSATIRSMALDAAAHTRRRMPARNLNLSYRLHPRAYSRSLAD